MPAKIYFRRGSFFLLPDFAMWIRLSKFIDPFPLITKCGKGPLMKFVFKLCFAVCTAWALVGCGNDNSQDDPATTLQSIRFAQSSYELGQGQTITPMVYLTPVGGVEFQNDAVNNFFGVSLSVVDPSIASVTELGEVIGLKVGTTTLTARSPYCATFASAQIVVASGVSVLEIESLRFAQNEYTLAAETSVQPVLLVRLKGESSEFAYDVAKNPYSVTWTSSNEVAATVSAQGLVTGVAVGTAILTARTPYYKGSASATVNVTAAAPRIASLRFEHNEYSVSSQSVQPRLMIRMTDDADESVYDAAANPFGVTWSVGDPSVASVSAAGVVTRLKEGATTLTARTDGYSQAVTTIVRFTAASAAHWVGEWKLASWTGDQSLAGKVYIELKGDNTCDIYQNVNVTGFAKFSGTYVVAERGGGVTELSGSYSDGKPWGDSYTFTATADKLTLTGVGTGYVSVYDRTTIPDYVKDGVTVQATRSAFTPFL